MSDRLNIIDTIEKQDQFSTFARLMRTSNTNDVFTGEGPFTVFAPTNDAFAKNPDPTMNGLLSEDGQPRLSTLLSYHILPGKVMAASLVTAPTRKAVTGEELMFTDVNGLKVNGASIQARYLEATNGVIHALDTVLTPSWLSKPVATTAPLVTPTAISARTAAAGSDVPFSATTRPKTTPLGSPGLSPEPAPAPAVSARADDKTSIL